MVAAVAARRYGRQLFFLSSLATVALGSACLILNAKNTLHIPGLLLISIVLMVGPLLLLIVYWNRLYVSEVESLIMLFIPLVFWNFIFYITMGVPVGFEDTHLHLSHFLHLFENGDTINFSNSRDMSYNFVGLYLVFKFALESSKLNAVLSASIIPPVLNLVVILIVYTVAKHVHSVRIGLVATLLFGWEVRVMEFGQEMRTQTMGTLLLFLLLSMLIVISRSGKRGKTSDRIVLVLLLLSIVTSSFTSVFFSALFMIAVLVVGVFLRRSTRWNVRKLPLTMRLLVVFMTFFLFYLLYIGVSFDEITNTVVNLTQEMASRTEIPGASHYIPPLYGPVVTFTTTGLWIVFAIAMMHYTHDSVSSRSLARVVIIAGFAPIIAFLVVNSITGPLSLSRIYILAFVALAVILAHELVVMIDRSPRHLWQKLQESIVICGLVVLVASNVVSLPSYVIGLTIPVRGAEPIDSVYYWDADAPQYALLGFLNSTAFDRRIAPLMQITNWEFYRVCYYRNLSVERYVSLKSGDYLALHDMFREAEYTYRSYLPAASDFDSLNCIYSNRDYLLLIR